MSSGLFDDDDGIRDSQLFHLGEEAHEKCQERRLVVTGANGNEEVVLEDEEDCFENSDEGGGGVKERLEKVIQRVKALRKKIDFHVYQLSQ